MKSSSSEILQTISNFSDYLYPFKKSSVNLKEKRIKQNNIRELYTTRTEKPDDSEISLKMNEWMSGLDNKALNQALTHKNLFITSFILESFSLTTREGRFLFKIKEIQPRHDSQNSVMNLIDYEKKTLNQLDSSQNLIEKEFENFIRFCDKDSYCDMLSFDPANNVSQFLAFAKKMTDDKCFKVPCRVSWESHANSWIWNYPSWFIPGKLYGLSLFALASFERALWISFWNASHQDPRVNTDSQIHKYNHIDVSCTNLQELSHFLSCLPESRQLEIIGSKNFHSDLGIKASTEIEALQNSIKLKKINCDTSSIVFIVSSHPPTLKNIDLISESHSKLSLHQFIEFLHFSPLDRVFTSLDLVCKKILINIASALSEKKAEDLIKDSKTEESSKKFQTKKKSSNKKRKFNNQKKRAQNDTYKEIAEDIINNIINELEENPEFQVKKPGLSYRPQTRPTIDTLKPKPEEKKQENPVSSSTTMNSYNSCESNNSRSSVNSFNSHRSSKPQQVYRKDYHRKPTKRPHSSQTKPHSSSQLTPKVQTAKTSAEVTPTKPETSKFKWTKVSQSGPCQLDNLEFPPLDFTSNGLSLGSFSVFHNEITRFCNNLSKKVSLRFENFRGTLDMIYSMISIQHPEGLIYFFGSYSTNLAIESSDIDLLVTLPSPPSRILIIEYCCLLSEVFRACPGVKYSQAITSARIPIVKLEFEEFSIDISYEDDEHSHQGLAVQSLVLQSLINYPGLREVTLMFKHLLSVHNLNCNFLGGLNAYGLFIWILAYFRGLERPEYDLGKLAAGFLQAFAEFDPRCSGIDVRRVPSFFPLSPHTTSHSLSSHPPNEPLRLNTNTIVFPSSMYPPILTLDPITGNNITSGLFQSNQILSLLRSCHSKLLQCTSPSDFRLIFSF